LLACSVAIPLPGSNTPLCQADLGGMTGQVGRVRARISVTPPNPDDPTPTRSS
jgi:hypothetical protein